jgi:hypothetical protein
MKKGFYTILATLLFMHAVLFSYAYYTEEARCYLEIDLVCYDLDTNQYVIEPEAYIQVEVINETVQEALSLLWAQHYPDAIDQVAFVVGVSGDVTFVEIHEAAFAYDQWFPLDFRLRKQVLPDIAPELNHTQLTFLPLHGQGMALLSNLSVLEALGYPDRDDNGDFLHDDFESFEAVFKLIEEAPAGLTAWGLSLDEPYAFYPYLTSHGWRLFPDALALEPGFHEPAFRDALAWIEEFSRAMGVDAADEDEPAWNFHTLLKEDRFIFTQVAPFMYIDVFAQASERHWRISRFPSVSGQAPLQPFLYEVMGYTLRKSTLYPSLAHEVLRFLNRIDVLEAYTNATQLPILRPQAQLDQIRFDDPFTQQFSYAHLYARSEPLIALESSPTTIAFRLYFDIDLMSTLQSLWRGEISYQQAYVQIAMASDAWLNEYAPWLIKETDDE